MNDTTIVAIGVVVLALLSTIAPRPTVPNLPSTWPVGGRSKLTQGFRPPSHPGVDICPVDATGERTNALNPYIFPIASGTVGRVWEQPNGLWVSVRHADGTRTAYGHLVDTSVVPGQRVDVVTPLGRMGSDPQDRHGVVHLHLQIRGAGGELVNPEQLLGAKEGAIRSR